MEELKIHVDGITKAEYMLVARRLSMRSYCWMVLIILACTILFAVMADDMGPANFLIPIGLMLVMYLYLEYKNRKGCTQEVCNAVVMDYRLDARGWKLTVGGQEALVAWSGTKRIAVTKLCLFLYNDSLHSNMIPLRLISQQEKEQILSWFHTGRKASAKK